MTSDDLVARLRDREQAAWLKVAKLAGEHGVRYRTNAALVAFLAAIFEDERAALTAALAKMWRPIESAPKNGDMIDLYHEEFGRWPDCYWGMPEHTCGEAGQYCDSEWHSEPEGWVCSASNTHAFSDGFTHWMPRHAPPETEVKG